MGSLASTFAAAGLGATLAIACSAAYGTRGESQDAGDDAPADPPAADASDDRALPFDAGAKPDCTEGGASSMACIVGDQYACVDTTNDPNNCGACGRVCNPKITNPCANSDCARTVFVSSAFYSGNLGGAEGADAKCTTLAKSAGLHGNFAAWLSTSNTTVAARFIQSTRPYYLLDDTLVANSLSDLTTMQHPAVAIDITEKSQTISKSDADAGGQNTNENFDHVWTNTSTTGGEQLLNDGNTCTGFTATVGQSCFGQASTNQPPNWTAAQSSPFTALFDPCSELNRLYCFEQ